MGDFFCKKSCERLSPPTTNALLVESTILFAMSDAAHCSPLRFVALHCKMGKSLSCAWCIELIYRVLQLFALYTFQRYQTKGAPHICIKLTINIK